MVVLGIETTCGYLAEVIDHPAFASGDTFTDFIPRHMSDWKPGNANGAIPAVVLAAAGLEQIRPAAPATGQGSGRVLASPWQRCGSWQIGDAIPLVETDGEDGGPDGS
jgi:acetyl/propionyl-CoA carboxylase alpha subunit